MGWEGKKTAEGNWKMLGFKLKQTATLKYSL